LALCDLLAIGLVIAVTYVDFARPLGRGVMLLGGILSYAFAFAHHVFILHFLRNYRERVAYIITCSFDELETRLFNSFGGQHLELAGVIEYNGYKAQNCANVLGKATDLAEIVRREKISRVLCTNKSFSDAALCRQFCQLRYSGVTVMPLICLCEEIDQYVPIELLTSEWLLNASGEPHLLYIKKIKRLFDIVVSATGIVFSFPLLLLAMFAVKISSPGPVFYRQTRCGRFGRQFQITKLRTMRTDAEANGAVWCNGNDDPRITPVGRLLRKYRIDEIPQLIHVFAGDMSFVGPRPERPEMIEMLAKQIPFYHERRMVQPGITGWAQVNYPYGSAIDDARRKLAYDLYYMKHMSLFLDIFILLDTVRIILCGGVNRGVEKQSSRREAMEEWQRLTTETETATTLVPIKLKSA